ncbi:hypothetical protein ACNUCX_09205 [Curtobacterium flaccumfaciens pv. flaccumfaciens]|uniref:hypothetical protein n=1 Tax=Curtobacterium flaccumfaciens TaxID=2035 RepID=UPI003AB1E22A
MAVATSDELEFIHRKDVCHLQGVTDASRAGLPSGGSTTGSRPGEHRLLSEHVLYEPHLRTSAPADMVRIAAV